MNRHLLIVGPLSNRNVQGLLGQCALAIVAILGTLAMLNL
jgi:hypothetical protein